MALAISSGSKHLKREVAFLVASSSPKERTYEWMGWLVGLWMGWLAGQACANESAPQAMPTQTLEYWRGLRMGVGNEDLAMAHREELCLDDTGGDG